MLGICSISLKSIPFPIVRWNLLPVFSVLCIPGLIQNLIKRKQLPGAIRLIYVFKLTDKFPPRDLLKDCLKCSNNSSKSFFKKKNRSPKAQVSFQNFKSSVTFLKKRKRKAMKKKTKLALGSKKHIAPVTPAAAPIPAPIPTSIMENNLTSPASNKRKVVERLTKKNIQT